HAALQCGFCTPGLLVAAKALLDRNPDPTETEARYWLAGNLCRGTGYDKIIRAVLHAAAELRGGERADTAGRREEGEREKLSNALGVCEELVQHRAQLHGLNRLVQQVQAARACLAQALRRSVAARHEGRDRPVGLAKSCYRGNARLPVIEMIV